MLFLLRPRQTWMPYALPRDPQQQRSWNNQLQQAYSSTRRIEPSASAAADTAETGAADTLRSLAQLHEQGVLDDNEYASAKAKVLGSGDPL